MRHLLVLLLLFAGLGCGAPAVATHRAAPAAHVMAPHGGCHDDGAAAHEPCVGCAIAPANRAFPGDAARPAALAYRRDLAVHPTGRRTGFDPPPPRAA